VADGNPQLVDGVTWYRVHDLTGPSFTGDRVANVSATARFDSSRVNLDLQLLTPAGELLDSSNGFEATETVSSVVAPGIYIVRVIKSANWGGHYRLTVDPGPRKPVADYDNDEDVDLDDYAHLQHCFSSLGQPAASAECDDASLDGDNDVDSHDLIIMLDCLSGANVPAEITCGQGS